MYICIRSISVHIMYTLVIFTVLCKSNVKIWSWYSEPSFHANGKPGVVYLPSNTFLLFRTESELNSRSNIRIKEAIKHTSRICKKVRLMTKRRRTFIIYKYTINKYSLFSGLRFPIQIWFIDIASKLSANLRSDHL